MEATFEGVPSSKRRKLSPHEARGGQGTAETLLGQSRRAPCRMCDQRVTSDVRRTRLIGGCQGGDKGKLNAPELLGQLLTEPTEPTKHFVCWLGLAS